MQSLEQSQRTVTLPQDDFWSDVLGRTKYLFIAKLFTVFVQGIFI